MGGKGGERERVARQQVLLRQPRRSPAPARSEELAPLVALRPTIGGREHSLARSPWVWDTWADSLPARCTAAPAPPPAPDTTGEGAPSCRYLTNITGDRC